MKAVDSAEVTSRRLAVGRPGGWGRYTAYKATGIPHLPQIPSHWEAQRLKFAASCNDDVLRETTPPETLLDYVDIASVSQAHGIERIEQVAFDEAPSRARRRVREGDTLLSTVRTYLKAVAYIDAAKAHVIASTGFAVVRPKGAFDGRYLSYQVQSEPFIAEVARRSVGVSYPAINASEVMNFGVALPPFSEQRAIAAFLDRETARIDTLIEKKRRLIALLHERRGAVITQAVTRGVDHGAQLKCSGVDWLGDIPVHWKVSPFKRLAEFLEGPGILAVDFRDEGVPLLRVSCVNTEVATLDGCNFLDPEMVLKKWSKFRVANEDLLISASASMGTVALVGPEVVGAVPYTGIIRLRPVEARCTRDFLKWFVVARPFLAQIDVQKAGSTIQHYGPAHLREMVMTEPPIEEQVQIVTHIEREIARIDRLRRSAEKAVERLLELRLSLIAAAVTGHIDVREAA